MSSLVKPMQVGILIGSQLLQCCGVDNKPNYITLPQDTTKTEIANYGQDLDFKEAEGRTFVYSPTALERYNHWIDSTLYESSKDSTNCIIVNKTDYALYLIRNGQLDSRYDIELGFNPRDDKQRMGDGCTPEGMYRVVLKRDRWQTSFYKAFLIDYPNQEDRLEGKTGSAIEIHGCGSGRKPGDGGQDWTLGCMALSNPDMDSIFPLIEEGDRITIVRYTTNTLNQ